MARINQKTLDSINTAFENMGREIDGLWNSINQVKGKLEEQPSDVRITETPSVQAAKGEGASE
ncbi:hypothetical protein BH762_gp106 [Gordonia phage OneUp]|uniref:Uncharacterized protein n=1 Tax=Gordonia phage OneUp TaxID=1838074 RepID=A0A166Y997_9CAUD|nr:hypothetical protein BH762_gp106 [Gordonia phage OneUp]ANA86413.1 hypothetical protein PBI_ONEUP_79 [Gordonia phage OneUp]